MAAVESSRFCPTCERKTLHSRPAVGAGGCLVHGVLALITGGLWLPVAAIHVLNEMLKRPRCQFCGRKA